MSKPLEPRHRRLIALEGFLNEIFVVFTAGPFQTKVARLLGAGPFALSLLVALPFLAQAGQLFGPLAEKSFLGRRAFVAPAYVVGRLFWLVPVAFVALGLSGGVPLTASLIAVTAMGFVSMVGINGWTAWMADFVPERVRADVFGARAWAVALGTLICAPAAALLIDSLKASPHEHWGHAAVGVIAALCGAGAGLVLARLPDVPPRQIIDGPLTGEIRALFAEPEFRRVLALFCFWNFAIGLPAPFWTLYMMEQLEMSFMLVIAHTILVLSVRLAVNKVWSRLIARYGSRAVLIACSFAISIIPLLWLLPRPDALWPVWIEGVVSGLFWTGFHQAAFIQPMVAIPARAKAFGLAVFNVVTGLVLFGSMTLGGAILEALGTEDGQGFYVLFIASSALRLLTGVWGQRLPDVRGRVWGVFHVFVGYGILRRPALKPVSTVGLSAVGESGSSPAAAVAVPEDEDDTTSFIAEPEAQSITLKQ